jgi:hypothetical protein
MLDVALKNTGANDQFDINSELGSYSFCMKQNIILTLTLKTTPTEMEIKSTSSEYFKLKKNLSKSRFKNNHHGNFCIQSIFCLLKFKDLGNLLMVVKKIYIAQH